MNPLEHLHIQLDLLTGLINISNEKVYEMIKNQKHSHLGVPLDQIFDSKYENFSNIVSTSVMVLGLSHFEDFLGRCVAMILTRHPEKNDLRIPLRVIIEKEKDLVNFMAEEESRKMTYSEKIIFLEKNVSGLEKKMFDELKFIYNIRNCIMHNNAHADDTLKSKYQMMQKISLTPAEVNIYGLTVRQSAKKIWDLVHST